MDNWQNGVRAEISEFTYQVIIRWPATANSRVQTLTAEHGLDRNSAFDEAVEMIAKHKCNVIILEIEWNDHKKPISVSDVTDIFEAECMTGESEDA